ncbi:endonuclease/exonuclease/phosphatase family protein [Tamlana fucoidanivorans]|nr:endonuclease/exonuclease/phosphatase family protein [Tamlana fucoidanivorans]
MTLNSLNNSGIEKDVKRIVLAIALLLLFFATISAQEKGNELNDAKQLSLMTYNIKFASANYNPLWRDRRDMQVDLINKYQPDVIATQEGLKEQIDFLEAQLPDYVMVGEGRQGGDDDEHMAIFYRRDKFRLRELNSFALSKTPEVLGSGPDINPRIVTWVRLAYKNIPEEEVGYPYPEDYRGHWENNKEFYVFNTHFFNGHEPLGRLNAAIMIKEKLEELYQFGSWENNKPIFLMGDFNCQPKSEPHQIFVGEDKFLKDPNTIHDTKIDWILFKGNVEAQSYKELDYNINGVYPSDHKPILVTFRVNK